MNFDIYNYVEQLCKSNKLAKENEFSFNRVSGIQGLQEAVTNQRYYKNFVAVDDFSDGKIFSNGTGWFTRYVFTVFIFARFDQKDMIDRINKLHLCRIIRNQFFSRFLADKETIDELRFINTSEVLFREVTGAYLNNCTGTYFQFSIDIPTSLCYDGNNWTR